MLEFNEEEHKYYLDGKELISVTTLLKKHGLAPDYSGVPSEYLKLKANKGILVHAEIENWVRFGTIGFTKELNSFIEFIKDNDIEIVDCEKMVYNDIVAGRLDLIIKWNGKLYRIDNKTTSIVHKSEVSWQLSTYELLDEFKTDFAGVFHFLKDGRMEFVPIDWTPKEEVERLMDCERNGVIYHRELTCIDSTALAQLEEVQQLIVEADKMKKEAESKMEIIKENLMTAMKQNGLKKYEDEMIMITYVDEVEKQVFDSKRFEQENPGVVKDYQKINKRNAYLKITLKGEQK